MAYRQPVGPGVLGDMMGAVKLPVMMVFGCLLMLSLSGCDFFSKEKTQTRTIFDQLGRKVTIPEQPKKIAALHHFGGKIVHALNMRHLLVEKSIYGLEAKALNRIDPAFAALPSMIEGHDYNVEGIVSLNPELIFAYASMDLSEVQQFENAGIPVVAVKGETLEESFDAIRLISDVLDCKDNGEQYIKDCRDLIDMTASRLKGRVEKPIKVMFAGPRSIYSVATGNMLQNHILNLSGAVNVARELTGFWADVSPEQIATWNPDVIFLGSYLDVYGKDKILENPQFQTVNAIKNKKIYSFPSNIGWWDYPAPHCVLGVVWSAKTLYPELFKDIDMMTVANEFYKRHIGHTFEEMGGRLD